MTFSLDFSEIERTESASHAKKLIKALPFTDSINRREFFLDLQSLTNSLKVERRNASSLVFSFLLVISFHYLLLNLKARRSEITRNAADIFMYVLYL